jgi:hypothetical protein
MATWSEFAEARADLVELALPLFLLDSPGGGLGYLATVRRDGGPRVHPISPAVLDGRLYAFVLHQTPKCADLHRDGRYGLHSWPRPFDANGFDDEEFYLAGRAVSVADTALKEEIAALTGDDPETGDAFELHIERALHKRRKGGLRYDKWIEGSPA